MCIFSSSHYVIASSKAFFFVLAFKICLRHQSVSDASPPKNNPGSPPPATSKSKTKFPSAAPAYWQHCSALIYLFVILFFSLGRKQMGHGVTLAGAFGRQRVALNELSQDEH